MCVCVCMVFFLGEKCKTQPGYNLLGLMRKQGSGFRKCSWLTQTIICLEITVDKECPSGWARACCSDSNSGVFPPTRFIHHAPASAPPTQQSRRCRQMALSLGEKEARGEGRTGRESLRLGTTQTRLLTFNWSK